MKQDARRDRLLAKKMRGVRTHNYKHGSADDGGKRMRLIDADNLVGVLDILCDKGGDIRYWEQLKWIVGDMPTINPAKWIPVKFRPMDLEEREYWEEQFGEELADEDAVMFDCPMPEDGQEILVSYRKWISMDKCEIDGGCYGLEGNGDWDDVMAWMPLPEPWEGDEDE